MFPCKRAAQLRGELHALRGLVSQKRGETQPVHSMNINVTHDPKAAQDNDPLLFKTIL